MSMSESMKWFSEPLVTLGSLSISAYNIVFFIIALSTAYWLTRLVRMVFSRIVTEADEGNHYALYMVQRFIHYAIVVIGVVIALSALGLDMSKLAMIATALSVGIGMGMQSIFNNFFSGFIILFERSMKVGDSIELQQGLSGTVVEIRVRSTLIRTGDNLDVVVPNSEFVTGRIANWTHNDYTRRLRIPFSVANDSEVEKVKTVVIEAANRVVTTLDEYGKKTDVWLERFGDNRLDFMLAVWVDPRLNTRPGALTANYLEMIEAAFRQQGIKMSPPSQETPVRKA